MSVRERKERERLARRETILAAAARVFAEHGVDGATIEMVARRAELAVGTIYLYFSSRDDLFVSLMAERIGQLRARYLQVHQRGLAPLEELRAIGRVYFDYLRESRGLFLAQLSVTFSQLRLRLSRDAEVEHFEQVRKLGRECFELYRDSVHRWLDSTGARISPADATRAATVIWAALNGAFLLMDDVKIFRDITGLEASRLLEETFELQLAAASAAAARSGRESGNGSKASVREARAVGNGKAARNGAHAAAGNGHGKSVHNEKSNSPKEIGR
jgi:AcrR family transcriptional regulator